MPYAAHPLFSAPASDVDSAMLQSFLDLEPEESFTVDYKRGIETVPETAAAMSNSYGGLVLAGIDARVGDKNLPGEVVGVQPMDKDRLVTKMTTMFDPPWWTPEVLPVYLGDKLVLVIRVDAGDAPIPLFYKGCVKVRLDGQNTIADRRLVQEMFARSGEPAPPPAGQQPLRSPDTYASPYRSRRYDSPPDLVVRATTSLSLVNAPGRLRLNGSFVDDVTAALSHGRQSMPEGLSHSQVQLVLGGGGDLAITGWEVDPRNGNSGFVRLAAGNGTVADFSGGGTSIRLEFTAKLEHKQLITIFDVLYWRSGQQLPAEHLVTSCREAVRALLEDAIPAAVENLVGRATVPPGAVELHVAPGERIGQSPIPLEDVVETTFLGKRDGTGHLRRGSEFLDESLVAVGRLSEAVDDGIRNMALEWRYLRPELPV